METLQILELKIAQLIERIRALQAENVALLNKIDALETSMLRGKENFEEEKALTRSAVDDLIKNIDSLIGDHDRK
jgi:predicted  nucleic acid-binding Zn-ribbon protein